MRMHPYGHARPLPCAVLSTLLFNWIPGLPWHLAFACSAPSPKRLQPQSGCDLGLSVDDLITSIGPPGNPPIHRTSLGTLAGMRTTRCPHEARQRGQFLPLARFRIPRPFEVRALL